ncbi:hypothetical protein B0181_05565 [Moraxella caviae]|nr:TIGR03862 family flavoprotein [Moraxella caviae]OOR90111.1 hypothetical protein B0181_05565 [Moraxella caviae]
MNDGQNTPARASGDLQAGAHDKTVAIVGAGAAGLMAAEVLSAKGVRVFVYEQMPSAGRKILWAGKTGLNISHAEPSEQFVSRYAPSEPLAKMVADFGADAIRAWLDDLGVQTYIGSSGRIFPVEMKASKFLRAWLGRLHHQGVRFFYRHRVQKICGNTLEIVDETSACQTHTFSAIILACGGGSYARLGSDGAWQAWFADDELAPLFASNVGVCCAWSPFAAPIFGQALKRVQAKVCLENTHHKAQPTANTPQNTPETTAIGDIVVSHYGLESGVIYRLGRALRQTQQASQTGKSAFTLWLDLLPERSEREILAALKDKKRSLTTCLKKAGLDAVKITILRECVPKESWTNRSHIAHAIKNLPVPLTGFRPMDEAISTGGGVRFSAVNDALQLKSNPFVFCAGEMLDWDAPTGGYLLTACLAMGRKVGHNVAQFLTVEPKS